MCLDSTGCLINIFNIFLDLDNHKQVIVLKKKKVYKLLFGCLEIHFSVSGKKPAQIFVWKQISHKHSKIWSEYQSYE